MRAEVFDAGEGSLLWCGMKRKEIAQELQASQCLTIWTGILGVWEPDQALPDRCRSYICQGFRAGKN